MFFLVLVLGLCFFAGGVRFSEQGFDASAFIIFYCFGMTDRLSMIAATQVHSSLLSISVGAVLLPAAYHFSLSGGADVIPESQTKNILRMSHGVRLTAGNIIIGFNVLSLGFNCAAFQWAF